MDPSPDATGAGPLRRKVTITNPHGFHLRPMQAFVELASQFPGAVRVWRDEQEPVDGRSMLGLMLLAAEQGMDLVVETEGPQAAAALDALTDLLTNLQTRVPVE